MLKEHVCVFDYFHWNLLVRIINLIHINTEINLVFTILRPLTLFGNIFIWKYKLIQNVFKDINSY